MRRQANHPTTARPNSGPPSLKGTLVLLWYRGALLAAGAARARASGYRALYLWVVRGNARARRFYERAGFVPDGAQEAYEVGGRSVPELRYRRSLMSEPEPPLPPVPSPRSAP